MNTLPIIPRIEDMPYHSSPPIQFVYGSTANLAAGTYVWNDSPSVLTPVRPLMVNSIYFFRSITMTADIEELDFTANTTTTPQFQMYLKSNAKTVLFREPVLMAKYLQNYDFRFAWNTKQQGDQLYASFKGTLKQGAALVGVASIKLTAIISCQEITNDQFIALFKKEYPVAVNQ